MKEENDDEVYIGVTDDGGFGRQYGSRKKIKSEMIWFIIFVFGLPMMVVLVYVVNVVLGMLK